MKSGILNIARGAAAVAVLTMLTACGGGDSGPPGYTVGGTVTGLSGPGLVLQNEGGADLPISASGAFTFATRMPAGSSYAVTVKSSPTSPPQACLVAGGVGTIAATDVTNVSVTCQNGQTVAVGGTVSGLVGSGLTLEICPIRGGPGGPPPPPCHTGLQVGANGVFTLDSVFPAGYSGKVIVAITQQPSSPAQHCLINNTIFNIQSANDISVTVSCTRFSYVTNAADNTLSAYSVDATTGALAVIGTPTVAGASPYATVGLEDGANRYVFVGNEVSNDVSALAVNNTTGALTAVPGSPFPAGIDPQAMALVYDISISLLVANAGSDNVSAYAIDGSGALTALPGSPVAVGKSPTSIAVDGSGPFVFVANHGGSNDISAFKTNQTLNPDGSIQTTLTPVPGSPFPAGGNPLSLAVAGKFLYSANPDATNPSISGFSIDPTSGALSPLTGSPFPLPVSHYMATDLNYAYLYVTSGANVVGYSIDANTGALTALAGFPVAVGANAYSITIDPTNQLLYVANDGAENITGFRLDGSTGALTPMAGSPFPAGHHPEFIATF